MSDSQLFVVDRQGTRAPLQSSISTPSGIETDEQIDINETGKRSAVWDDEDDDKEQVDLLEMPRRKKLRQQVGERQLTAKEYETRLRILTAEKNVNRGQGTWAELDTNDESDDDDDDNRKDDDDDDGDDDGDGDDEVKRMLSKQLKALMQSTGPSKKKSTRDVKTKSTYSAASQRKKKPINIGDDGKYNIKVMQNANAAQPSACEVRCLEFHPTGNMILVAGRDKHIRLFHIDGMQNQLLQSLALTNFPIRSAMFTRHGSRVVATGEFRHLYALDIETGATMNVRSLTNLLPKPMQRKVPVPGWEHAVATPDGETLALTTTEHEGRIVIVSEKSMMATGEVRLNAPVTGLKFSPTHSHLLYCTSRTGAVYLFDVRNTAHCVDTHRDQGAVHTTCLGVSPTHYACGSDSGIVNIYSSGYKDGLPSLSPSTRPLAGGDSTREVDPLRVLTNLRHPINCVEFSKDGQLMAFSTHDDKAGMRIFHVPSMTVFRNWPTQRVRLHRTCSFAFSPDSRFLAMGQSDGTARLLRLAPASN